MESAVAFYDYGRWVADCPNPQCTNALLVDPGQQKWLCRYVDNLGRVQGCLTSAPLAWPENREAIEADLAGKPESAQHWKPGAAE